MNETNLLLQALSPSDREAILAQSKEVTLPVRAPLYTQEENPRYTYFLTSGVASVVVTLPEGNTSETCIIGREGFTGGYSLLGAAVPTTTCFMQIAGRAYRLPFPALRELFDQSSGIRARCLEQIQQVAMTTSQMAACNNAHEAEARLARWLLMVQDRTGQDTFALTQEFLSEMLGARRTTVALAAGTLQRGGFIEYSRGKVRLLARELLEAAACDCYAVTRRLLDGLYGQAASAE